MSRNEVDIWRIQLSAQEGEFQHYRSLLSPDEVERADRFYFEKDRCRFVAGRGIMRQILGDYADQAPEDLVFSYSAQGKPELAGRLSDSGIQFNMSHSSDVAILAVAHGLIVGVDVEWINPEFATEEIAERFFSASEANTLRSVHESEKAAAFFSCWTRKEAYIKALGYGLSIPLDRFEVAFGPEAQAALLRVENDPAEVSRWSMYDLEVVQGYKAALVAEGKGHRLQLRNWRCPRAFPQA